MPRRIPVAVALGLVSILAMSCTAPPPGHAVTSKGGAPAPLGSVTAAGPAPTATPPLPDVTATEGDGERLACGHTAKEHAEIFGKALLDKEIKFGEIAGEKIFQEEQEKSPN